MKAHTLVGMLWVVFPLLLLFPSKLDSGQIGTAQNSAPGAIIAILNEQQAAWNRGDVVGFMKGYWNSPQLTFVGGSGITRGWQTVLDRYREKYPDAQAMGHLEFSELEVHPLGSAAALVLGHWQVKRSADGLGGLFTLVFERFPEGWRIIHDHTSAEEKKP